MFAEYIFPPHSVVALPIKKYQLTMPIHRIFCVGRNYLAHANEMGSSVDKATQEPFYFLKHPSHYAPSGSTIAYPSRTQNLHHEMELAVIIGKEGANIPVAEAKHYIFGYACALDMTRRDLQAQMKERRLSWDIAKDFENGAIISEVVPIAECGELTGGKIELSVNGEVKQSSDLAQMIWSVDEIIAHLSTLYTLMPGDVIMTGTPEGVGAVVAGDELTGHIEGVGDITLKIAE